MYLPKRDLPFRSDPNRFKVDNAKRFLTAAGALGFTAFFLAAIMTLRRTQNREREEETLLLHQRKDQRVVIIGSGTGGSSLAATICSSSPQTHVTVVEMEHRQTFHGVTALANVGHRSYDVNATGGVDFLHSPASWNVTREANLVKGEVLEVRPEQQEVLVKPIQGGRAAPAEKASSSFLLNAMRAAKDTVITPAQELTSDGATRRADGTLSYPYDVLIIASGAQRTLGNLAASLQPSQLDAYRVAVSPGITRDSLAQLFEGTILHVKVPPSSFVAEKEEGRRRHHKRGTEECVQLPALETPAADTSAFARLRELTRISATCDTAATPGSSMYYASRQHDGTFASSVNTIWRYLYYFNKFGCCQYMAVTADADPIGPAPVTVNEVLRHFWRTRQEKLNKQNFHFLTHSYLTHVDSVRRMATLYNYKEHAEIVVPFGLLLLDLPLRAPEFIRRSGLHRGDLCRLKKQTIHADEETIYVNGKWMENESTFVDVDPHTLQHRKYANIFAIGDAAGLPTIKSYGSTFSQLGVVAHNVEQLLYNGRARKKMAEDDARYEQNLIEYNESKGSASEKVMVLPPPVKPMHNFVERKANAKFDGYSSFQVCMTTWRAMWPEMVNPRLSAAAAAAPQPAQEQQQQEINDVNSSTVRSACEASRTSTRLTPLNHHLWNNTAWYDPRGVLNAAYYQTTLYEMMYFFAFTRGVWFGSTWFSKPLYSPEDGSPLVDNSWL